MISPTADSVIKRLSELQGIRVAHEAVWQQIAKVAAPDAGDFSYSSLHTKTSTTLFDIPQAAKRSKDLYDTTAVVGVDRLASIIESLICPQNERWHDLDVLDFSHEESTDEEKRWLERLRNLMFRVRYDSDSGWTASLQTTLRRLAGFGNGFMFVDEGYDDRALIRYRAIPLEEGYAGEDHLGYIDQFYRPYTLTARQALQKFGDKLPEAIKMAATNEPNKRFSFIHAIGPREDWGRLPGVLGAKYYSVHVSLEETKVVSTSGFHEFPIIDFRWLPNPGQVYAEGPVQKCLADIQSLNLLAKNELIASQQAVKPPLIMAHAGVMNRPNSNPGAVNFGGMNAQGQRLVDTLFTHQRLDFAAAVRTAKASQVKECLYLNLFQILVQGPQMSATEALIRAQEKGDLLGPAGGRLQQSLSNLIERELGILARKGAFAETSVYRVPPSLQGKALGAQFVSPLDRMRRASEAQGFERTMVLMQPLLAVDPELADHIDGDPAFRGLADVNGMPAKWLRPMDQVIERREQRRAAESAKAQSEVARNYAQAGKLGSEALANARAA